MNDGNQAGADDVTVGQELPAHGAPPGPGHPALRMLLVTLLVALLGLGALVLGQVEAALLIAAAALYLVAQAADTNPALARLYALLGWLPSVGGAVLLAALVRLLLLAGPRTPGRIALVAFAGLGALVSLATLARPVREALTRRLFRGAAPSRTLQLTATATLVALWMAAPAWLMFRDQFADFLRDPRRLISTSSLSGSLVGYVALAFCAVGAGARRSGREALERLGLTALRVRDGLWIAGGVAALWLFNGGGEWLERSAFPDLWANDNGFTEALASVMGPWQMLLLGLSAGIGEEITLRGALQPKLGIFLTSLLFAALHVQYSWYGMLSLLVFGLLLGWIRQRSSTTAAICVHALYDVLAVATTGRG